MMGKYTRRRRTPPEWVTSQEEVPRMTYDSQGNKSGCIEAETPALVLLRDGNVIDTAHQFVNTDGQLCVYLTARETEVDAKINLDDVVAVVKSDEGARALNIDVESDSEELVADGGWDYVNGGEE